MIESISRRDLLKAAGAAAVPLVGRRAGGAPLPRAATQRSADSEPGAHADQGQRPAVPVRGPIYNVMDFGAKGDGVSDDTAAIEAADTAATSGATGVWGGGGGANGAVQFPAGTYVHTGLHYRGAPWSGAGTNVTVLKHSSRAGASVDAVGTNDHRRLLSISDMTFDGSGAGAGAYCLRLGYNMRSLAALRNVRISRYPAVAMLFKEDNWILSFYDVFLQNNAGGAFSIDAAVAALNAFEWFNLVAENNGAVGSGVGGIELNSAAVNNWNFCGGVWESNVGAAEARFLNCASINLSGTYIEPEAGRVTDGLVFGGTTDAVLKGIYNVAGAPMAGSAFVVRDTANVSIDSPTGHAHWATMLSVSEAARVILSSEGKNFTPITVQDGAACIRLQPRFASLSDAARIAVDASRGTVFTVTLTAGGHTMGKPTNPSVGQRVTFCICQDGVGGHTLNWDGVYKVTWSDTNNRPNHRSLISLVYYGGRWNQEGAQSPYAG